MNIKFRLNNLNVVDFDKAPADELYFIALKAHKKLERAGPPTAAQLLYSEKLKELIFNLTLERLPEVENNITIPTTIVGRFVQKGVLDYVVQQQPATRDDDVDLKLNANSKNFWTLWKKEEYEKGLLVSDFDRSEFAESPYPGYWFALWTKKKKAN